METRYRNTDLDLISDSSIDGLSAYLTSAGMIEIAKFQSPEGEWHASFEVSCDEDDPLDGTAQGTINAMLGVLSNMPKEAQAALEGCKLREFNVAYDIGTEPRDFNKTINAEAVSQAATFGFGLRITLYPNEDPELEGE